jgi:hypothetical protein
MSIFGKLLGRKRPEDFAQRAEARRAHGNTRDRFRAQSADITKKQELVELIDVFYGLKNYDG